MATEYRLVLPGIQDIHVTAARAFPAPTALESYLDILSGDFTGTYGFHVTVAADDRGYLDVESDGQRLERELGNVVDVTFRIDYERQEQATLAMAEVVARVLATGPEDAFLVLDGETLLLTRLGGKIQKHRRETWWVVYSAANEVIRDCAPP